MDTTPKYAISVAAEFVGMHPQTLRLYESRRLVVPRRSAGGRRLYSDADLARLENVKALTSALGLNHSGVEHVLALEQTLNLRQTRVAELERELADLGRAYSRAVAERDRSVRHEVVVWQPPSQALAPRH
jgi:MerR family transcriptional regulator, heat shock protein HspR